MFGKENAANRERMKENVINRLQEFFERYFGL